MARRSSRTRRFNPRRRQRGTVVTAPRTIPRAVAIGLSDLRLWNPQRFAPAPATRRLAVRLTPPRARKAVQRSKLSPVIRFANPRRVLVCARRKSRRQVLFALGLRGKGSGAARRRRNQWSDISCR